MSWHDRLQPASFRGVPFHVSDASERGGRRVVVHEYANQEEHDTEDLGKRAGEGTLRAFLVGTDYDVARDKLITALTDEGAGTLVHPYLGSLSIRIISHEWNISSRRGGFCEFTIQYIKAGRGAPVFAASTADAVIEAADTVDASTSAAFVEKFTVSGQPEFVRNAALEQLDNAIETLYTINGKIGGIVNQVSDVAADIDEIGNQISTLIQAPATLISTIAGVASSFIGAVSDIKLAFGVYDQLLAGFTITNPISRTARNGVETATRAVMADNQAAIASALRATAVTTMARIIADDDSAFTTYSDAIAVRDALLTELDDQSSEETLSYDEYRALTDLQTAVYERIQQLAPGLQQIRNVQIGNPLPALVVTHQQYGDISNLDELIARNRIGNPLFLPAGKDIEVLV